MVIEAFSTRDREVALMILELINPQNYNENSLKEYFLSNMYRIVSS